MYFLIHSDIRYWVRIFKFIFLILVDTYVYVVQQGISRWLTLYCITVTIVYVRESVDDRGLSVTGKKRTGKKHIGKKRTRKKTHMYISAWEKSALGKKRTRKKAHTEKSAHYKGNSATGSH